MAEYSDDTDNNKKTINWLLERQDTVNLADEIDDKTLEEMGDRVIHGYDEDSASLEEWREDVKVYIEAAMQETQDKSYPWEGAANIKVPTLTVAANQFHARAYPDIVQSRDIVKGKVTGYDHDGTKASRAERIGKHMTYQLMEEMPEWEDDMDRGLLVLPVVGCFFKKTYYDPHKARNVSKAVWAQDLVIDYDTPSLDRAARISEMFELYPQEIEECKRTGLYLDVDINYEDEENDEPEEFIEQHTTWDLDEDGYKEPYIITVHRNSGQVVRVVARWDDESIFYMEDERLISVYEKRREVRMQNEMIRKQNIDAAMLAQAAAKETENFVQPAAIPLTPEPTFDDYRVAKIEPIEYYTLFPFLPNPDGSIYSMGFGHLLHSLGEAANTTINQMLDASHLANLGGGFMAKSPKRPSGWQKTEVGEYIAIETNGMPVRDAVLPFTFRGPSAQSFSLLEFLMANARDITGLKDISTEMASNTQATTAMIIQEESSRTYSSLYKRIFRSTKDELRKLFRLNKKYLPEDVYYNVLDTPAAVSREDYNTDDMDVQPVGDPTQANASQRILRAQAALQTALSAPIGENLYVLKRKLYEALDIDNIDDFLSPPSTQADPRQMLELRKLQAEYNNIVAETGKTHSEAILNIAKAESEEVGNQIEIYRAELERLQGVGNARTEQTGLGGVDREPSDTGDVQTSPELPADAGGELGAGSLLTQ
jgi:chaperonin GroES